MRTEIATRAEHLWSPEDPYLYDVMATLGGAAKSQEKQDIVRSYCAFRTVEIKPDLKGVARFHLNGKPLFLKGVLDQGYWPDSLLTAPSDKALIHDIIAMKKSGFNMLRKHIKIETARWYYHCDRLGMLVWQDAVSGGLVNITRGYYESQADAHAHHVEQVPRRHGEAFRSAWCRRFDVPP